MLSLRSRLQTALVLAVMASPAVAVADPCTAPLPKRGAIISGQVRYVGDGDSLCIGPSSDPSTWVEIRIADFYAPELNASGGREAKASLERLALGRPLRCLAGKRSFDRVVAQCALYGEPLGRRLRDQGTSEGGRGFQPR